MLLTNLAYCLKQPTGTTTYALNLLPYLDQLQSVYLSALSLPAKLEPKRIPVPGNMTAAAGMKGHARRLWWTQTQLPRLFKENQGSLLFCPIPEAPRGMKIPYVVTVHDLIPLRFYRPWAAMHLYSRFYLPGVLAEARHIICNSQATADDVMDYFDCSAKDISVIPLAYDETRFRWLDLPTSNYFLCLGRSAPHKNWGRVLAAFASLPQRQDYELWLVGPKDARFTPQLLAQARDLGIVQQVKVLDFLEPEELVKVINQAIALVFPSLWEGFGLPIVEAMACGTPVITSNFAPMSEVAGGAALLVNPYQMQDISQAMKQIMQQKDLRSHLSNSGRKYVFSFTQERMGRTTIEILQGFI